MRKIFTEHCLRRLAERKINIKDVDETIDNPHTKEDISTPSTKKVRFTRTAQSGVELIVICEVLANQYRVLTVWGGEE